MVGSEGIVEVQDGEEEAEELPECDHQGHCETGTLSGENKDRRDAEVLSDDVTNEVEKHGGEGDVEDGKCDGSTGHEDAPVIHDVWGKEEKSWQRQGVCVEQSFFGMLSELAIYHLKEEKSIFYIS